MSLPHPRTKVLASDLHVEFFRYSTELPNDLIIPQQDAAILDLLGDMDLACGNDLLPVFLVQQAERFEHVVFLAGNHECYNAWGGGGNQTFTIMEQDQCLRKSCALRPTIHCLERQVVIVNHQVVVLGTTLWSYIPPRVEAFAERHM